MLFIRFLEHSMQMGVLIVAVLLLTWLLQHTSKLYSYILWILVFVYLLVPVQIHTPMGILPEVSLESTFGSELFDKINGGVWGNSNIQNVAEEKSHIADDGINKEKEKVDSIGTGVTSEKIKKGEGSGENTYLQGKTAEKKEQNNGKASPKNGTGVVAGSSLLKWILPEKLSLRILFVIWLMGVAVMACYGIWEDYCLQRSLKGAVLCEKFGISHVYQCVEIGVPIVRGVIRPGIYLPSLSLEPYQQHYILEHEQTHIRRRDPLIKAVSYGLFCLHWFNPLVWLAFTQLERSMEFSCDEAVIKRLGNGERKAYSRTLLAVAAGGLQRGQKGVLAVGFMKKNTKKRIKNVLDFSYHGKWITGVVTMVLVGCFLCFLGGRGNFVPGAGWRDQKESTAVRDEKNNSREENDAVKSQGQDDKDRKGLPVVVLDNDGNIIGTYGGKALKWLVLDYFNIIENGRVQSKDNSQYRIESGAFSACGNMEKMIFWNGSQQVSYVAEDAFRGCPSDLEVYCEKNTYLWKRLKELGITCKENSEDNDIACMLTNKNRGEKLQKKMEEQGLESFSRGELQEFFGNPYFLMVEGGRLIQGAGSLSEEVQLIAEDIPYPSETRIIDGVCGQNLGTQQTTIPKEIEEIGDGVFFCTDLKKLAFETEKGKGRLKRIGDNAFSECSMEGSPKLVIPEGVTELGQSAFSNCRGLREVVLPKSLKKIGNGCFSSCHSLKKVTIKSPDVRFEKGETDIGVFEQCGVEYIEEKEEFTESDMTIYAPRGSTAERYAKEKGNKFKSIK